MSRAVSEPVLTFDAGVWRKFLWAVTVAEFGKKGLFFTPDVFKTEAERETRRTWYKEYAEKKQAHSNGEDREDPPRIRTWEEVQAVCRGVRDRLEFINEWITSMRERGILYPQFSLARALTQTNSSSDPADLELYPERYDPSNLLREMRRMARSFSPDVLSTVPMGDSFDVAIETCDSICAWTARTQAEPTGVGLRKPGRKRAKDSPLDRKIIKALLGKRLSHKDIAKDCGTSSDYVRKVADRIRGRTRREGTNAGRTN